MFTERVYQTRCCLIIYFNLFFTFLHTRGEKFRIDFWFMYFILKWMKVITSMPCYHGCRAVAYIVKSISLDRHLTIYIFTSFKRKLWKLQSNKQRKFVKRSAELISITEVFVKMFLMHLTMCIIIRKLCNEIGLVTHAVLN